MKKGMKRLIACLSATFMLFATLLSGLPVAEVKAAETLPIGLTEINFTNLNKLGGTVPAGVVTGDYYGKYTGTNMDGTVFYAKVTFPTSGTVYFKTAGSDAGKGIEIKVYRRTGTTNDIIEVADALMNASNRNFEPKAFDSATEGFAFTGKEIAFKTTIQYVDSDTDGAQDDVKLGIWFDGTLLGGEYIILQNYVNSSNIGNCVSVQSDATAKANGFKMESATTPEPTPEPEVPEVMPTGLTETTFRSFGVDDGSYTAAIQNREYIKDSLGNTVFKGKINFSTTGNTYLMIGGTKTWQGIGLQVYKEASGRDIIKLYDAKDSAQVAQFSQVLYDSETEKRAFTGVDINLALTIQYIDNDKDGSDDDVKFGIWLDGVLLGNDYHYFNNYVNTDHSMGKHFTMYLANARTTIASVDGVDVPVTPEPEPEPEPETPEVMPSGLTEMTFISFGVADGTYKSTIQDKEYIKNSLKDTVFKGKINFSETGNTYFIIGGTKTWQGIGLQVYKQADGTDIIKLYDAKDSGQAAQFTQILYDSITEKRAFTGVDINLALTIQYIDNDKDGAEDDVKFGIWLDGVLLGNDYHYYNNYVNTDHSMGKHFTLVLTNAETRIASVPGIDEPIIVPPEVLPEGLKEISFSDFGIANGTYTGEQHKVYSSTLLGVTLADTVFHGKVNFPQAEAVHIKIGGKEAGTGIELKVYKSGTMDVIQLSDSKGNNGTKMFETVYFTSTEEGISFTGKEVDLKLTIQYIDSDGDGKKDDVKFGIWIDDVLLKNEYQIFKDYVNSDHSMGTWFSLIPTGDARKLGVTVKSASDAKAEVLPSGLKELTFRDFGIKDGTHTGSPSGEYDGDSLNNTVIHGKVTFSETGDTFLIIGGKESWGGFGISTYNDQGTKVLRLYDTKHGGGDAKFNTVYMSSKMAGVPIVGQEVDMKISIQYVALGADGKANDVRLGIWFYDVLYNNQYFYLENYVDNTHSMGNWLTIVNMDKGSMTVKSVGEEVLQKLPSGLTELTFDDFGIKEDFYAVSKGGSYSGKTLNNTVIKGTVTFSENGQAFLIVGGKVSMGGFYLSTTEDTTTGKTILRLFDTRAEGEKLKFPEYKFYSNIAGTELVGKAVELMLSIQFVDKDKDGAKDDVKLGVWFNGKLYDNRYIYLPDYVNTKHSMGTNMNIYLTGNAQITIGNPKPIDLSQFGFDANWQTTILGTNFNTEQILSGQSPNTGDVTKYTPWMIVSVVALVGMTVSAYPLLKRRKETK